MSTSLYLSPNLLSWFLAIDEPEAFEAVEKVGEWKLFSRGSMF
jgi:hypothetical protein